MRKIIISGKGGSGKTTISSLLINRLASIKPNAKILAIDADPAYNLLTSLGTKNEKLLPIGELADLLPNNQNEFSKDFFDKFNSECLYEIEIQNKLISYGFIGHHFDNSCLCSYNNTLNYLLEQLGDQQLYDYVILDREAGLEHINRSVYGGINDRLIVVSSPTNEYLQVAKEIFELGDMLGTTNKRLLVINNTQGLTYSKEDLINTLNGNELGDSTYIEFPKLNIFNGLQKIPANELIETLDDDAKNAISKIVEFIE